VVVKGMVTVTDTLPAGLTYVAGAGFGWTCSAAEQTVTCTNPGPIDPGTTWIIRLTVSIGPPAWPGVTNLAVISNEGDRNTMNNVSGDPTAVSPGQN
jgi:hypothetical protein